MTHLTSAIIVSTVFAVPVASFAQSSQPLTRAQVRAELIQLVQAGYNPPIANQYVYPADIQAGQSRVAAQSAATSFGPAVSGSS